MSTRPLFRVDLAGSNSAPLDAIVFMKIGFHVGEPLDQIITRKTAEQNQCGRIFWGYGGNSCHPTTQIVPFVAAALACQQRPVLAMKLTESRFEGTARFATEFSADGVNWMPLPKGAVIKGSKYAIVCQNLRRVDATVDLSKYQVAVGPSAGKTLSTYLRYRVDKACAAFTGRDQAVAHPAEITYIAELVEPYAVFVR